MKAELEKIHRGLCNEAIPNGWRVVLLKELSLLKISNGAFNDPKFVGSGYKLINIVDLYQGPKIRTENLGRLSLSESEYKTFKVLRDDLFFTRSSLKKEGIAHCNIFLSDEDNVVYECHMMRVRPNPELVDPKYLQEFCLAGPAREYFISHGKTTTMTTIDQGSIGGLPVLLPPLPEQKKIAAILTAVDEKLDVIARQIEATQTLRRGLMQTLFSKGMGTQDANGNWIPHTEFQDSELGEIPEAWEIVPLGGLIQKLMDFRGRTPKKLGMAWGGGDIPALSANNVRMGYIDFDRECYLGSNELYSAWMVHGDTKQNDLVFTMEAPLGNVAVIPDDRKYILSQRVILLRPTDRVSHSYLFQYLRSDAFAKTLDVNATGTTAKGIQQKRLVQLPVVLPSLEEQGRIADVLGVLDAKLDTLSAKRAHYSTLKRGLMQKLLTGAWRVKLDSPSGTA